MLRAVLGKVEVVPSSSSMLREAAVICRHPFEFDGGSSATAIRQDRCQPNIGNMTRVESRAASARLFEPR